jgi:hypothetical protein
MEHDHSSGSADFAIAGLTIRVTADCPFTDDIFVQNLRKFRVSSPTSELLRLKHVFSHWPCEIRGVEIDSGPVQRVYSDGTLWSYVQPAVKSDPTVPPLVGVFVEDHTEGILYHPGPKAFLAGGLTALSMLHSDQIFLARALARFQACYFHSAGVAVDGRGFLFVGHSEAGKSTLVKKFLQEEGAEVLCDDRIVVRRWEDGFRIHGTWSHGEVPVVSPGSAPLRAIFFIEKADHDEVTRIRDQRELARRLPFYVVRAAVTPAWWDRILDLVGAIAVEVPVFRLRFRRDAAIRTILDSLTIDSDRSPRSRS